MKTENKKFYVTLEYHCSYSPEFDYTHEVGNGFKSFDSACTFADTVMEQTKNFLTACQNYTVTFR